MPVAPPLAPQVAGGRRSIDPLRQRWFNPLGLRPRRAGARAEAKSEELATVTRHIFVTGGVVSSLGKGLTSASIGMLLEARGLRVRMQKLDPYINVDPGTMSPYQHGEVYVLDDGSETDLDLGHYERFTSTQLTRMSNYTTGQI